MAILMSLKHEVAFLPDAEGPPWFSKHLELLDEGSPSDYLSGVTVTLVACWSYAILPSVAGLTPVGKVSMRRYVLPKPLRALVNAENILMVSGV